MIKPILQVLSIFACFFSLIGCASSSMDAQAKITSSGFECPVPEYTMDVESQQLNLLVRAGSVPVEMIECYELVYGVKVIRYEFNSDEELYIRLSNGGVNYDLLQPSALITPLLIQDGKLQQLNLDTFPSMGYFDPKHLNLFFDPGNKYTIPYQAGSYGIVVNTGVIDNPINSWKDLWNDDYIQRMIMPDDGRPVIGMSLLTLGYDVNSKNEEQLKSAQERLGELVPNIKIFDGETPAVSLLSGNVDLGIIRSSYVPDLQNENSAFQYVYPSEGAILWQENWAIPSTSRHVDAAYAWLNYTAQGNVAWLVLRDYPVTTPNLAALEYASQNEEKYYNNYMKSTVTNIPPEAWLRGHFVLDVGEATTLYNNIWAGTKGEQ